MSELVLTVQCKARRGIVSAVSTYLAENGCNITDSAQFDDAQTGRFFSRITFKPETGQTLAALQQGFAAVAKPFAMNWAMRDGAQRMKVVLMVMKLGDPFWTYGAMPVTSSKHSSRKAVLKLCDPASGAMSKRKSLKV